MSLRLCVNTLSKPSKRKSIVVSSQTGQYSSGSIYDRFGWFWECPNGDQCQYRHALPPGFVLKSQRKAAEDAAKGKVISLEEFLEVEVGLFKIFPHFVRRIVLIHLGWVQRHKLGPNLTPVTPESFAKWKKTRMDKKEAEAEAMRKAKEAQHSAGKNTGMSGRDLVRTIFSRSAFWLLTMFLV